MPGIIHKKKDSGAVFPPDWREIGYVTTPESTMDGFNYAKQIQENWDTSVHTYIEAFRDDYMLMYFPNMSYEKRYSMERCDRMFQNSNIEYFDSDLPFIQQFDSAFASCRNLRYVHITGMENWGVNTINQLFVDCYQLEDADFDFSKLPSSCIRMNSIFSGCWNLKNVEVNNNYIETAATAFQNTYKLENAIVKLPKCYDTSFYAAGSQTTNGVSVDFVMGQTATQGVHFTFEKAKINCYPPEGSNLEGSKIVVKNCNTMQSAFRQADINLPGDGTGLTIYVTDYNNAGTNCSFAFQNATSNIPFVLFTIQKVSNALSMFDGLTFDNIADAYIDLSSTDFSLCTNISKAFANCNVQSINSIENKTFTLCTNFENMFQNSPNLDDTTINGLLIALTTAITYSGTKTLAQLGFNSTDYPAARIQNLNNYSTFTAAGWSIGY